MIHQREGLALGVEAGQHVPRVHAPLDQLERHRPPDGCVLLRLVDDPHPAFTDLPQNTVGTDTVRTVAGVRGSRVGDVETAHRVGAVFGHAQSFLGNLAVGSRIF